MFLLFFMRAKYHHEHWKDMRVAGETELSYQAWLEETVSEVFGIKKEEPSIEDDGPGI